MKCPITSHITCQPFEMPFFLDDDFMIIDHEIPHNTPLTSVNFLDKISGSELMGLTLKEIALYQFHNSKDED